MKCCNRRTLIVWVLLLSCSPAAGAEAAKEILDATGVKGGLIVHLGCGDGELTAALRANDSFLVLGLDADAANLEKARRHIDAAGLGGKVSLQRCDAARIPCVDNLVNLLVSERPLEIPMPEVLRALAPGGVAYVKTGGRWTKTVKPRPDEIDHWTHYLHDAGGNAVAHDSVVGPPRHAQWMAAPTWSRNHHTLASISAVVSTEKRIFYIVDEASAASMEVPGKWSLVGRDAFNGMILWKRAIPRWAWHRHGFRSGPVQLPRTLVAEADRVYAPLGIDAPVSALDAATGQLVRTYKDSEGAEEILLSDGVLMVVTGSPFAEQAAIDPARRGQGGFPNHKTIKAFRAATGEPLWQWSESQDSRFVPMALAADKRRVFFRAGKGVICLAVDTGKVLWRQGPAPPAKDKPDKTPTDSAGKRKKGKAKPAARRAPGQSVATLVAHEGVVLSADGKTLSALAAETGKPLWNCPCKPGFRSPSDVFVIDGLVWLGTDFSAGRDLYTGEVKKTNTAAAEVWTVGHHHRCYREKATDRYIITGKRGMEFLDLLGENHSRNNWVRGVCQYGMLPCNGLVYAPSHACGCFMEAKLWGFWALAAERQSRPKSPQRPRLEKGPAFDQIPELSRRSRSDSLYDGLPRPSNVDFRESWTALEGRPTGSPVKPGPQSPAADSWPTHRHDSLRSGSTPVPLPARLRDLWQADVGGRLSAPVVAEGTLLVSSIDSHRVAAFRAADGKPQWTFTAGGRVDSPPTIYRGLVLFGCADGRVYCLRLGDGQLVWRFRAAPEQLNMVVLDQLESVWPVHGSVLVENGTAYCAAGRSSWLDGGIFLYGLNPATGRIACRSRLCSVHPKGSGGDADSGIPRKQIVQNATDFKTFTAPDKSDAFSMGGATTDILVSDGEAVFMRHLKFDSKLAPQERKTRHLFSTSRLFDGAEVHRSHWVLGTGDFSRIPVAYSWIANKRGGWGSQLAVPYGLMLAFDDEAVCGARRTTSYRYQLFACRNTPLAAQQESLPDFRRVGPGSKPSFLWMVDLPMRPRAMLRAGERLFLGGMPGETQPEEMAASYAGRKGGLLWAVSTSDGSRLAEYKLRSPPVWDGMAAAGGRMYLSTVDGKVLCLAGANNSR